MAASYVELHAASAFSFLQGASLPEALVDRAAELGYPALALLDRDGVYGAPRFHKAATAAGIKPIIGAELTIVAAGRAGGPGREDEDTNRRRSVLDTREGDGPSVLSSGGGAPRALSNVGAASHASNKGWCSGDSTWLLPVLCESAEGYRNLCRLITRMKMRAPKGEGALTLEDLDGQTRGLVALAGRAALDVGRHGVGGLVDRLVGVFGRANVFVELQRHLRRDEEAANDALVALAGAYRVPTLATGGVRFATPSERPLFDVLTCIHHGTTVALAGRRLAPNAERYLKAREEMAARFRDYDDAVARTSELADRLQYTMADLGYRFPDYPVPPDETQASFLRKITDVGARERYRPYHDRARAQISRELDLIEKLELSGYFLIVWDIVNFCRQHDILVQGRGSAANSAVCYSLGITAVDPVGMDLLFERFLSEERGEWPDIDLDLPSGDRREQVIQHVYAKYGALGAAMTANVITYRGRSAAREVGKVLGFEPAQIDRLAKVMNSFEFVDPADSLPRHLASVGLDFESDRVRLFARLWGEMQDLPRHLGQHSGGMVICQGRLDACVPLENASMPGRVVVQWDKDDCADMGIVKVDLLGLGMMAVIQDAFALVNSAEASAEGQVGQVGLDADDELRRSVLVTREGYGPSVSGVGVGPHASKKNLQNPSINIDLAHLPPDDPDVYRMLQTADTIGLFQVESRAQMATLPRLYPKHFYDIVVQVAIIRPGPIVGKMVHPYLNRRAGREPVTYPHPSLEPVLARTLGVPLFQEQLLRMAMIAAGFTGGQAEDLRRAFGFKRSERRMKQVEVQLREGMARQGIGGDAAEQIIASITSFALYGFPESHAASFALLAYASAYLKAHYPSAFYAALLNNQPMGFYHPSTLVKDAQRRGVRFHSIDVQISDWNCTVEADGAIRLGLRYVSGLRQEVGKAMAAGEKHDLRRSVLDTREGNGPSVSSSGGGAPRAVNNIRPRANNKSPQSDGMTLMLCPKCGCDDASMLERVEAGRWFCNNCSHDWEAAAEREQIRRFVSVDDLVARTGLRRDELVTLADIGALNAFGYDRRSALWQAERAVRPSGEMFEEGQEGQKGQVGRVGQVGWGEAGWAGEAGGAAIYTSEGESLRSSPRISEAASGVGVGPHASKKNRAPRAVKNIGPPASEDIGPHASEECPLRPMTESERLAADYAGTGLTTGRHPMALRRDELAMRGVLRAVDLPRARQGRRVRIAGMVITRQRPGTAKGFVFLTLEDETGIANIIVRPDLFARDRLTIIEEPFLLIDGLLQNQEGVVSVRAERVQGMRGVDIDFDAHDFY